mmetsp:Transcript_5154/g.15426  ORF Transcript_5154/g.15426 Transcript_5154/m.15426 type:complete len:212 (-) Transcript_5154:176-811(-)
MPAGLRLCRRHSSLSTVPPRLLPHDTKDPAECVEVEVDLSRVSGVVVRKEVTTGREKRSKPDILCHSKKSALHVVERCAHCMQRVFSQEEVVRPKRLVDLRKGQDTIPVAVHLHERARYARDEIVNADKFLKVDRPAAIHVVHTKQQRADVLRHLQPRLRQSSHELGSVQCSVAVHIDRIKPLPKPLFLRRAHLCGVRTAPEHPPAQPTRS